MGDSYTTTTYTTGEPIKVNKSYTTTTTTGKPIEFNAEDWHKEWTLHSPITIKSVEEPKGWVCPLCGRVNAPWVKTCECSDIHYTIAPTGTGIPSYCTCCPNHPSNGGSGICLCILGGTQITC